MELTDDKKHILSESLKKVSLYASIIQEKLMDDKWNEIDMEKLSRLLESYTVESLNALDFDSILVKQSDARYEEIRQANKRIQRLEKELADKHPLSGLSNLFKKSQDTLSKWWKEEGFSLVEDMKMLRNGSLEVSFGFHLIGRVPFLSENPKSEHESLQKHIRSLRDSGFVFFDSSPYGMFKSNLIDTDENKELLNRLVQSRFPSFEMGDVQTKSLDGTEFIMSFSGVIQDMSDFSRQPQQTKE